MNEVNHAEWSLLRYNYYLGGRNLLINGQFDAAGLLLAYAVELSLKHALNLCGEIDSKVLKSHNHPQLKRDLEKYSHFQNQFEVSEDFLLFNEYYINSRYISKKKEFIKKNNIEFHYISPNHLADYDDFLFQIDKKILEITNNILSSIFARAYLNLEDLKNIYFVHGNFPFHSNISIFESHIEKNKEREEQLKELKIYFNCNKNLLWDCPKMLTRAGLFENAKANSKKFKWKKEFNARGIVTLNSSNLIHPSIR